MNKKILLILAMIGMTTYSCSFVQLFEVSSKDLSNSDEYFQFENDTLRIVYNFYSEGGIMSFLILNKLKVPLYVDWRRSSFILNDSKNNYWEDIVETKTVGSTLVYNSRIWNLASYGLSEYTSLVTKPERITFVPPSTLIPQNKFSLYTKSWYSFQNKPESKEQILNNKKVCKIEFENYNEKNNPLLFRNFLTLSTSENFTSEFYLDNSFYVHCVKRFKSKFLDNFRSPKAFFIKSKSTLQQGEPDFSDPLYE